MGNYEIEVHESTFDMKEYNELVRKTQDEVRVIQERQRAGAEIELAK